MKTFVAKDQGVVGKNKICRDSNCSQNLRIPSQQTEIRNILHSPTVQTKLTIGEPNDKYEQEADQVADQVMRMPDPGNETIQRQDAPEEEENGS